MSTTSRSLYETLQIYGELPQIILFEPLNRNLRDDPRSDKLLAKVGKSRDKLAAIEFDVTSPNQAARQLPRVGRCSASR